MAGEHEFRLLQGGMVVATVSAADRAAAFREIMHYAMIYGQDGPCTITGTDFSDLVVWKSAPQEASDG